MKRTALLILTLFACLSLLPNARAEVSTEAAAPVASGALAQAYLAEAKAVLTRTEANMDEFVRVADIIADRHIKGGLIGLPNNRDALFVELIGRSGGIIHIDFGRPWKPHSERTADEIANDMAIIGWARQPSERDLREVTTLKDRGVYVVGFGPRDMEAMASIVELCDAWFDTGYGNDDRVLTLPDDRKVGRMNDFANTIQGWTFTAEIVAALTRRGKMPTMWKSWAYPDGREWSSRYFGKMQFHDDYDIRPHDGGELGREFLSRADALLERLVKTEIEDIAQAAQLIAEERKAGRRTVAAWSGHMPQNYLGQYEDRRWAQIQEIHPSLDSQMQDYQQRTAEGALVLRVGYQGVNQRFMETVREKNQRLILMCGRHTDPNFAIPDDLLIHIDMGYELGDALVPIDGYPIRILPPSGFMQAVVYNAIDVEVQHLLPAE